MATRSRRPAWRPSTLRPSDYLYHEDHGAVTGSDRCDPRNTLSRSHSRWEWNDQDWEDLAICGTRGRERIQRSKNLPTPQPWLTVVGLDRAMEVMVTGPEPIEIGGPRISWGAVRRPILARTPPGTGFVQ